MILNLITPPKLTTNKVCPECGEQFRDQEQCYLQECDRCLAKKEEM